MDGSVTGRLFRRLTLVRPSEERHEMRSAELRKDHPDLKPYILWHVSIDGESSSYRQPLKNLMDGNRNIDMICQHEIDDGFELVEDYAIEDPCLRPASIRVPQRMEIEGPVMDHLMETGRFAALPLPFGQRLLLELDYRRGCCQALSPEGTRVPLTKALVKSLMATLDAVLLAQAVLECVFDGKVLHVIDILTLNCRTVRESWPRRQQLLLTHLATVKWVRVIQPVTPSDDPELGSVPYPVLDLCLYPRAGACVHADHDGLRFDTFSMPVAPRRQLVISNIEHGVAKLCDTDQEEQLLPVGTLPCPAGIDSFTVVDVACDREGAPRQILGRSEVGLAQLQMDNRPVAVIPGLTRR